jgi:cytochrome c553
MKKLSLMALLAGLLVGCAENTKVVPLSECNSGIKWSGSDEGSEEMHPGMNCIGCHTARGDGPHLAIAGTVYDSPNAEDDCRGLAGAVVRITDADGKVQELVTNAAGNFLTRVPVTAPYTAALVRGGVVVAQKQMPQTSGACNSCHTSDASPGRILVR